MKNLQIRNMPDDLHRRLKVRAATEGRSMSDLVLREIERSLAKPTLREWFEQTRRDEPFDIPGGSAALIRAERDSR
jgi:antitoxin FitA